MTIDAVECLRSSGDGANDPGSMSLKRIFDYLNKDGKRREKLGTVRADQGMVRLVVAETVKELSDRIDHGPDLNIEKLKPRPEDKLTKPRYQ